MKGILNGIILVCLGHSTAFLVITTYAVHIFENVDAMEFSPYVSSIAIAIVQLVATLCTTHFSDTLERKAVMIASFLGSAIGLTTFAFYSFFKHNDYDMELFDCIPVASLSLCLVIFSASAGVVPLMFLCIVENLPSKVSNDAIVVNYWNTFCTLLDQNRWCDHL